MSYIYNLYIYNIWTSCNTYGRYPETNKRILFLVFIVKQKNWIIVSLTCPCRTRYAGTVEVSDIKKKHCKYVQSAANTKEEKTLWKNAHQACSQRSLTAYNHSISIMYISVWFSFIWTLNFTNILFVHILVCLKLHFI